MAKGNKSSYKDDKEFAILLNTFNKMNLIEVWQAARAKAAERLINLTIEEAKAKNKKIEIEAVEQRIKELFSEQEKRSLALLRVINEQGENKARRMLECAERLRIFFFAVSHGWKKARRAYGRWYVDKLMKEVHQSCSEEVTLYKRAWRDWREARRRFLATKSEPEWSWYKSGKGNKNSVAYRTKVDLSRHAESHFRNRRLFKYMSHELLSRKHERRRARKELREAQAKMSLARQRIYQKMGIPFDLV